MERYSHSRQPLRQRLGRIAYAVLRVNPNLDLQENALELFKERGFAGTSTFGSPEIEPIYTDNKESY